MTIVAKKVRQVHDSTHQGKSKNLYFLEVREFQKCQGVWKFRKSRGIVREWEFYISLARVMPLWNFFLIQTYSFHTFEQNTTYYWISFYYLTFYGLLYSCHLVLKCVRMSGITKILWGKHSENFEAGQAWELWSRHR